MFICDVNWNGDLCMDYTCNCHATCTLPQPKRYWMLRLCCKRTQKRKRSMYLQRRLDWCANCSVWTGDRHNRCNGFCSGPSAYNCSKCNTHAHRKDYGECVCDRNWDGSDCSDYTGLCYHTCVGCTGHYADDLLRVSTTPISTETCECEDNWGNLDCSRWIGACHSRCNGCHRR
jgi:hypothetical protein